METAIVLGVVAIVAIYMFSGSGASSQPSSTVGSGSPMSQGGPTVQTITAQTGSTAGEPQRYGASPIVSNKPTVFPTPKPPVFINQAPVPTVYKPPTPAPVQRPRVWFSTV